MEAKAGSCIEKRADRSGRLRVFIAGTRIRVQDIYADSEIHGMTPDEIAAGYPQLSLAQIHAALAYYFDHQAEIDAEMRADRELVEQLRRKTGPGPFEQKLKGSDAPSDSLSS